MDASNRKPPITNVFPVEFLGLNYHLWQWNTKLQVFLSNTDSEKQVGNPETAAFASLSRRLKHSKLPDPKGSAQSYSSLLEKLANQGQLGREPLDLVMLGTINQGIKSGREVTLGYFPDGIYWSPKMC